MLFNSFLFLLVFLPIALGIHYLLGAWKPRMAALWLCVASIVFYGWWNPQFVVLLAGSIVFNYLVSLAILSLATRPRLQVLVTALGVAADLLLLFHYKYFAAMVNFVGEMGFNVGPMDALILPLGISFFTFTQIGYLLDCRAGVVNDRSPLSYVLFVTFFPHLIAGPILHHKEMMPQFSKRETYRFQADNLSVGGMLFVIGLAKKVLLADTIAPYADAGFAETGSVQFWGAWATALSYALQLYFDFSGYSDMALGLARMFGIRFPLNFNSPYKATSVIDFWARWHMTLTRYITAYLYYPVAMAVTRWRTRHGRPTGPTAVASAGGFLSMIVLPTVWAMGLGGMWPGAGLRLLLFVLRLAACVGINPAGGGLVGGRTPVALRKVSRLQHVGYLLLTFGAVLVAQAFFRADGVGDAWQLVQGMAGVRGWEALESVSHAAGLGLADGARLLIGHHLQFVYIVVLLAIVWGTPNAHQIMGVYSPSLAKPNPAPRAWMRWQPTLRWLLVMLVLLGLCLMSLHKESRFLYFQF